MRNKCKYVEWRTKRIKGNRPADVSRPVSLFYLVWLAWNANAHGGFLGHFLGVQVGVRLAGGEHAWAYWNVAEEGEHVIGRRDADDAKLVVLGLRIADRLGESAAEIIAVRIKQI